MRYLSLFSGIEAASCAWESLGWTPVAFAEIEPFPCSLLAQRFPGVPNLGDVTVIADEQIAALGHIDVVIGGSPCQDLSVAGKRAGLVGARSSLFHEQVRIFDAARTLCGARWLVWENVPGAFSTHGGRDFARVVGDLAGCKLDVPGDGWGSEGVALGERGLVEWAVLDAQWFGVAQRRRRVFAVLDAGDWAGRAPVLLEPESLRGDHPPRRGAGESATGTLAARARGSGELGTDMECDGGLVPEVAWALRERDAKGSDSSTKDGHLIPVAFSSKDYGADATADVALTLRAMHEIDGNANGGGQVAVVFTQNQRDEVRTMDVVGALPAKPGMKQSAYIAFDPCGAGKQTTLGANSSSSGSLGTTKVPGVVSAMQVRRLTPTECERLQGFPDGWTAITHRGKPAADGPRYRALGNSMAVPVISWLGRQIQRVYHAND